MEEWLKQNKVRIIFNCLIVGNILVWSFFFSFPDKKFHLKVYDVGQGDAIFIQTASNFRILIDGGPDNKVLDYLGKEVPFYSKRIDLLVLTHPEADHITGLVEVAKRYEIRSLWVNGDRHTTRIYSQWKKWLEERNIKPRVVSQGDKLLFSDSTKVSVIWPRKDFSSQKLNDRSIVVHLSYGDFDAIITGDADKKVQPYTSNMAAVEVFKVPHHGAKDAVNEEFMRTISPSISVISVGEDNPYGHPRLEVINLLQTIGSKVYRTDKNGTVEIVSDGKSWYTRTSFKQ